MATGNHMALALTAAAGWMSWGCSGSDDEDLADGTLHVSPHWSYDGELGPERWGELDIGFATCSSGTQQSPIDIPSHISPGDFSALTFDYAPAPATLVDNGHTVQVNLTDGASEVELDGDRYSLVQFHFHAHSEHSVDGVYMPLELHLVHRSAGGSLAVVGVFLEIGEVNAPLSPVFDGMQHASLDPLPVVTDVDPAALLPGSLRGWAYAGSLTTPPCTEGVRWHVMSTSLQVSAAQLDAFTKRHDTNRRPVMENAGTVSSGSLRQLL
jgi:carbonic anhydrase